MQWAEAGGLFLKLQPIALIWTSERLEDAVISDRVLKMNLGAMWSSTMMLLATEASGFRFSLRLAARQLYGSPHPDVPTAAGFFQT